MSTLQCSMDGKPATLHVFAQDDAWHWAISVPRERGCGVQVIAYNESGFASERDAMSDGTLTLNLIANVSVAETGEKKPALIFLQSTRIADDTCASACAARWRASQHATRRTQSMPRAGLPHGVP